MGQLAVGKIGKGNGHRACWRIGAIRVGYKRIESALHHRHTRRCDLGETDAAQIIGK
jgi:hypothetical protein